jgi:nitric oxide synthase-interacting protein
LKTLIPVKFTLYTSSTGGAGPSNGSNKDDAETMCPSCKKHLSNNLILSSMPFSSSPTIPHLDRFIVSKPCGHVTCKTCTETLVKPSKQCIVCDTALKEKDIIELKREGWFFPSCIDSVSNFSLISGTGFAGGGLAETSKTGVAFQG